MTREKKNKDNAETQSALRLAEKDEKKLRN